MQLLVLYEELAWYFVNCMNTMAARYDCRILIICKSPVSHAPFDFRFVHPNITIRTREQLSEAQLAEECRNWGPDGIYLGGWKHKPYLQLIKAMRVRRTVIGFDNQWTGSLRQRLGAFYFRCFVKRYIDRAFVPGAGQLAFALRLGFDKQDIGQGAYCCDLELFSGYYQKYGSAKEKNFPKRFLYVGRYAREKAVEDLWNAFIAWQRERPSEWELWCLGKGEVVPPAHEKIRHFGFLQPEEMGEIVKNTGVFVLPSTFEPWGVVVQEYAAAGFPLICSDRTGAAATFVEEGRNGFLFEAGNQEQLKEKMNTFSTLNQRELTAMAAHSARLAAKITPPLWAERLMKMFSNE